jgi:hypothetical protein
MSFNVKMGILNMDTKISKPKTQKARGIIDGLTKLNNDFEKQVFDGFNIPYHHLITSSEDIDKVSDYLPKFARPCPKRPRHGFVESRLINTREELISLFEEVKKQDKYGEIVLGPNFETINNNCVYVSSGLLSVGAGNDGATGGKKSISFPVAPYTFSKQVRYAARIKETDSIYIEGIKVPYGSWCLVQMRGGPTVDSANNDFIPKTIVVKKVVRPDNNLLNWEKKVKTFESGTVVYGTGYTLASHAAVHCILHDIPFVTTKQPHAGEILKSTENANPSSVIRRERFKKGVAVALKMNVTSEYHRYFGFCLSVLHNWAYLRKSQAADYLIGAASAILAKLGAALCFGEYRHIDDNSNDGSRDQIYRHVMRKGYMYMNGLPKLFNDFASKHCNRGFGGIPWANCAWYTNTIWEAIVNIYNGRSCNVSNKEIVNLIEYINRTLNLAHNGGWWFNKISSMADMDFVALNPGLAAIKAADIFYNISTKVSKKITFPILQKVEKIKEKICRNGNKDLVWAFVTLSEPWSCWDDGDDDCYESDDAATLHIQTESEGPKHYDRALSLSSKELLLARKKITPSGRIFLNIVPNVGFRMPGGRIIPYSNGIKKVA